MTLVVTRNVPDRYRGFLASVMLEISPGTYASPRMNRGVRERIWEVCRDWSSTLPDDGSVTMAWRDPRAPGGLSIEIIGSPKASLVEVDGLWLDHHELTMAHRKQLDTVVPKVDVDPPSGK
jgi:CRISPR-associated protein Cas2